MSTKALRDALKKLTPPNHHDRDRLLARNGRWGTCVECPCETGLLYPERCVNTDRYDHQLRRDNDEAWTELEAIERAARWLTTDMDPSALRHAPSTVRDAMQVQESIAKDAP